jgi:hypothetical protein
VAERFVEREAVRRDRHPPPRQVGRLRLSAAARRGHVVCARPRRRLPFRRRPAPARRAPEPNPKPDRIGTGPP